MKNRGTQSRPYSGLPTSTVLGWQEQEELGLVAEAGTQTEGAHLFLWAVWQSARCKQTEGGIHWWPKRRRQASPGSQTSPGFNEIPVGRFSGLRSLERSLRGGGQIGEATVGVGGLMSAPPCTGRPCLLAVRLSVSIHMSVARCSALQCSAERCGSVRLDNAQGG